MAGDLKNSSRSYDDWEPKFRVVDLSHTDDELTLEIQETTWSLAQWFHEQLRTDPSSYVLSTDGGQAKWINPLPLGNDLLPGILVIHGIVLTQDNFVLISKRSASSHYAPGSWSLSFEEQVTATDLSKREPALIAATLRGLKDEFYLPEENALVVPITIILEIALLNLALVTLTRLPLSEKECRERWNSRNREEDGELTAVEAIPLDSREWHAFLESPRFDPLHPTSRIRFQLLNRWRSELESAGG